MQHAPSFLLPQLADSPPPSSVDEEARIRAMPESSPARKAALLQLEELRRIASGFKREEDWRRSKQEAMDELWRF